MTGTVSTVMVSGGYDQVTGVVLGFHASRIFCVVLTGFVVSVEASLDETCVAIDLVKALGIVAGYNC